MTTTKRAYAKTARLDALSGWGLSTTGLSERKTMQRGMCIRLDMSMIIQFIQLNYYLFVYISFGSTLFLVPVQLSFPLSYSKAFAMVSMVQSVKPGISRVIKFCCCCCWGPAKGGDGDGHGHGHGDERERALDWIKIRSALLMT